MKKSLLIMLVLAFVLSLNACNKTEVVETPDVTDTTDTTDQTETTEPVVEEPTLEEIINSEDKTLVISTWANDIDIITEFEYAPFEEMYGVKIELDTGRDAERFTKLQGEFANTDIDVFLSAQVVTQKAIDAGLIGKIDRSQLSNIANIYDIAVNPNGLDYGVCYTVNRLKVAGTDASILPTTWAELFTDTTSKIAIPHMSTTFGPALLYGSSYGNAGDGTIPLKQYETWSNANPGLATYTSTFGTRGAVINGEFDYALFADYGYTPDLVWGDLDKILLNCNTANIVEGTDSPTLAHLFIDYLLSQDIQQKSLDNNIDSPVNMKVTFTADQQAAKTDLSQFGSDDLMMVNVDAVIENQEAWVTKWNEIFTS